MSTPASNPDVAQDDVDEPTIIDFVSDPSHLTLSQGHAPVPDLSGADTVGEADSDAGSAADTDVHDPWEGFALPEGADPRTQWPASADGSQFRCTAASLLHFLQEGVEHDGNGNVTAIKYWCVHRDGRLEIVADDPGEADRDPWSWPLPLMAWPGATWIEQWNGDFQRAVDEQLQPAIDNLPEFVRSKKALDEAEAGVS